MELRLSAREQRQISLAQTDLLSPLTFDDLDAWRRVILRRFSALVSAERSLLLMPSPVHALACSETFTAAEIEEYEALFPNDCGREHVRATGLEVWTHAGLLAPNPDVFYKSWIYHDFYRPRQLEDGIGYVVESSDRASFGILKLHHSRFGTRNFGDRGQAILNLLLPAFKAGVRTCMLTPFGAELDLIVDAVSDGLAIFDCSGHLLHQNQALQEILRRDPQRVEVVNMLHQVRLSVTEASGQAGTGRDTHTMIASSPYRREVATQVGRYEVWGTATHDARTRSRAVAVVFVRERGISLTAVHTAGTVAGLTTRETQVLSHLVRGASAKQIAVALGVRVSTAQRHTEAVLRKFGTHARSELAGVVLRLSGSRPSR
jgi:DNA-binding CsgD family transcriptional regulator